MKHIQITLYLLLCMMSLVKPDSASAQRQKKTDVRIEVVDSDGFPVGWSNISSSKNRYTYTTGEDGVLMVAVQVTDVLKVSAAGYLPRTVSAADIRNGSIEVVLERCSVYEDEDHQLYTVTGDNISEYRTVGAYSKIDGSELEENPTMFLYDAFGGRLGGMFLMNSTLVPGFTAYNGFVRAPNGGTPIIMVDGVERSLDYIEPETIESVQLLKDASLKSLFGGIQSNGILLIKTKRGKPYENSVRVNVQSGVEIPTNLPQYLNSREYAEMYNQALANVGRAPVYDPSKYDGSNPLLYPDVDYYDYFLNDVMTITRANAQLTGGSKNTQYFLNLGFQTNGGLEKFTDYPNRDRVLTVRGNVDNAILDFMTLRVGINAAVQMKSWPNISTQDFMSVLADTRPNEYPITIPGYLVGSDEEYVLGGTATGQDNPLGILTRNGFVEREYSYLQSDFALDISLDKWVRGLSIRPTVTFDFYNEYSSRKDGGYSVTEILGINENDNTADYKVWGLDTPVTSLVRGDVSTNRNWAFATTAKYDRAFGKHEILAIANYFMQEQEYSSQIHSRKRLNLGVMANYMYDKKYIVDASMNYVGVPSFAPGKRFGLFPTIGLGWVMSENDFMQGADWVDYLKLKASYGVLGSTSYTAEGIVSNYYYRDEWATGTTYGQFSTFSNVTTLNLTGNPDAGFQKSHEINAGVDYGFFNNSLHGSVGYFRTVLTDGLANLTDVTAGVSGKNGALVWSNYKEYMSQGAEAELYYTKRFGDFQMTVGGNFTYGYSEVTRDADIPWPEELSGLAKTLRDGDTKGYTVIGTYKDQADIDSSPKQTFGKVYPGDLKYQDVNGDGIIDERDLSVIANTQPSMSYGITISLKYKGFNLDILGYGLAGFDRMLTTKYYQLYGDRKYSEVLYTGLPNGNPHPVLRADNSTNNFVDSDYWVVNGGYFKLRNVEFGYTFPHKASRKIGLNVLKFFVRGTNLFTISEIKDLNPENPDAGVGNFPLCTTVTGGVSFSF